MSVAGSYQKFDVTIEDPGIAIITFNTPECASPLLERGGSPLQQLSAFHPACAQTAEWVHGWDEARPYRGAPPVPDEQRSQGHHHRAPPTPTPSCRAHSDTQPAGSAQTGSTANGRGAFCAGDDTMGKPGYTAESVGVATGPIHPG